MRPPGHRDRPGQNLKCPASRLDLTGQATGTDRTQPYRGVPLSRCPGNRPTANLQEVPTVRPPYSVEIGRNAREVLKVTLQTVRGVRVLDARVWEDATFGPVACRCPTKRGFDLDPRRIPDLIQALQGAHAEATALGLLEDER